MNVHQYTAKNINSQIIIKKIKSKKKFNLKKMKEKFHL